MKQRSELSERSALLPDDDPPRSRLLIRHTPVRREERESSTESRLAGRRAEPTFPTGRNPGAQMQPTKYNQVLARDCREPTHTLSRDSNLLCFSVAFLIVIHFCIIY